MPRSHRGDELTGQPALADSRRTVYDGHPWTARLHGFIEEAQQGLELAVTTDHWRPQARHAALWLRQRTEKSSPGNGSRLALQVEANRLLEGEAGSAGEVGSFAHQHRPGSSRLLEPSGNVHGVPGHDQLLGGRSDRRDDLAGVDADPDLKPDPVVTLEALVERLEPLAHLQGGVEGTFRVVLADGWDAENGHDGVPDVLLDGPAPRLDDVGHLAEVGAQQRSQAFGVQLLAEARGTGDVGEQDRDDLALLPAIGQLAQLRPAARAEVGARRDGRAAGRAGEGHARSLGGAESA